MRGILLLQRLSAYIIVIFMASCSRGGTREITVLATTDLHGTIHNYDFTENRKLDASLAGVAGYIRKVRETNSNFILLDNGDNLQGQPSVYYYNFEDTVSPHILGEAFNYLGYDAVTVGNHDIETGHAVYDRIRKEYRFPMLAANAVHTTSGKPYFDPYLIIQRNGLKVAVFGLITPNIPNWLPPELYSGIEFRDMLETAREWMIKIEEEKPDIIIGLFHSGWDRRLLENKVEAYLDENGSASVAYNVPGFDLIINGHDHARANEKIVNIAGDTVLILDGGSRGEVLMRADITVRDKKGKGNEVNLKGSLIEIRDYPPDEEFVSRFSPQQESVKAYVNRVIGSSSRTLSSRDSYFGPSPFIGMIHELQMKITGAEISFAAPLSFDVSISAGPITVGDMFKLYRYENMLYTVNMTGDEIKKYLEYSYSLWYKTMKGQADNMLLFRRERDGKLIITNGRARLENPPYNFDSASGIDYEVDLSKPEGSRISIRSFTDGSSFELNKTYRVAVNSYRANGGGGHFEQGAGLEKNEMKERVIKSTDKDLRFYFIRTVEETGTVNPGDYSNWKILPEHWVKEAKKKDYRLLFGDN